MRPHIHALIPLLAALLLTACYTHRDPVIGDVHDDVDRLSWYLTGTFDSSAQAAADHDNFFNIRLVMVRIWEHRSDARWLYVEQAAASALDKPYRQRVFYKLHRDLGTGQLRSDVYTLPGDPLEYAACWNDPRGHFGSILTDLLPEDLTLREGCTILFEPDPDPDSGAFTGATRPNTCISTLRGAAYATSEVTITPDLLISWDRGWTADGTQAWGATEGGYRFVRISPTFPPRP